MSLLLFLIVQNSVAQPPIHDSRWNLIRRRAQEANAVRAFEIFRKVDIEPVLIKGLAAAAPYPDNVARESVDLDLAVAPEHYDVGLRLAASPAAEGIAIDLHRGLRHLDTRAWSDLIENSREIKCAEGTYRVLRPEDHFRVLCVHWLNDGGTNHDRLWDIYYLVQNRAADFDWTRVTEEISPYRKRWIDCTLGLCEKYLGLGLTDTPFAGAADRLPGWIGPYLEHEWKHQRTETPLWLVVRDPAELFRQVGLRLAPNPIRATIEMNGSLDQATRVHYRVANFVQRLLPSLRRNAAALKSR